MTISLVLPLWAVTVIFPYKYIRYGHKFDVYDYTEKFTIRVIGPEPDDSIKPFKYGPTVGPYRKPLDLSFLGIYK